MKSANKRVKTMKSLGRKSASSEKMSKFRRSYQSANYGSGAFKKYATSYDLKANYKYFNAQKSMCIVSQRTSVTPAIFPKAQRFASSYKDQKYKNFRFYELGSIIGANRSAYIGYGAKSFHHPSIMHNASAHPGSGDYKLTYSMLDNQKRKSIENHQGQSFTNSRRYVKGLYMTNKVVKDSRDIQNEPGPGNYMPTYSHFKPGVEKVKYSMALKGKMFNEIVKVITPSPQKYQPNPIYIERNSGRNKSITFKKDRKIKYQDYARYNKNPPPNAYNLSQKLGSKYAERGPDWMNMFSADFNRRRRRKQKKRFIKIRKSKKKRRRQPQSSQRYDKQEDNIMGELKQEMALAK